MPNRKKFYRIFWKNEECRSIFSMHKEQLLEKLNYDILGTKKTLYNKQIVLSNTFKFKKHQFNLLDQRTDNTKIDINTAIDTKVTDIVRQENVQNLLEIRLGKTIEKVKQKTSETSLGQLKLGLKLINSLSDEKKLIALLQEFHVLPKNISTSNEMGEYFKNLLNEFVNSEVIVNSLDVFDKVSDLYSAYIYKRLAETNQFYIEALFSDKNFKDRINLFDILYESNFIKKSNNKTFYECLNCERGVYKGVVSLRIIPSNLKKLKCPVCDKEVLYLSPYELDEEIYHDIVNEKDGLISVAANHLLTENEFIIHKNFIIPPNTELDFVAFKNNNIYIIESKVYKLDTPEHTQASNLRTTIDNYINKKYQSLINYGYYNFDFIILTNYTNPNVYSSVKSEYSDKIKQYRIRLHTLDDFKRYVEEQ